METKDLDQNINMSGRELRYIQQHAQFCRGKWQREMPQKEGRFVIADYKGNICGTIEISEDFAERGYFKCIPAWGAFWWSEPIPENFGLPPVPESLVDEMKER